MNSDFSRPDPVALPFLIHGCVVQGLTGIGHFGPVAIGAPDERIGKEVNILVERFGALLEKL